MGKLFFLISKTIGALFTPSYFLIAIGIVLFAIVSKLERLAIPWHVSIRAEETAVYQS